MTQDIRTPDLTYLALSVESNFQEFFKGYIEVAAKEIQRKSKSAVIITVTPTDTCGQIA